MLQNTSLPLEDHMGSSLAALSLVRRRGSDCPIVIAKICVASPSLPVNASCLPSGDQVTLLPGVSRSVTLRAPLPSAFITQASPWSASLRVKATLLRSAGERSGRMSQVPPLTSGTGAACPGV
jgi:hypothetical protein